MQAGEIVRVPLSDAVGVRKVRTAPFLDRYEPWILPMGET